MERVENGSAAVTGLNEISRGYHDDFMQEIRGVLDEIDISLVNLEAEPSDREQLHQVFCRFHTIGGLNGLLQEKTGMRLAQSSEDMLEAVRKYRPVMEPQVINHLVSSSRFLRRIVSDPAILEDSRFSGEVGQHLASMRQSRSDLVMEARQALEHETRIGEILIREGAMEPSEVDAVLQKQQNDPGRLKFGEILLKEKRVEASDVIHAIRMQKIRSAAPVGQSVRIPLERMDQLVQLVDLMRGTCGNIHAEALLRFGNKDRFAAESSGMTLQLEDLRRILGELRTVTLHQVFTRFTQSVGSLLEEKKKTVRVTTIGEGTEMDMETADQLLQPMIDMAALMVGLCAEMDEDRKLGSIEVVAFHEGDGTHIDISGDCTADMEAIRRHPACSRAMRSVSRMGGRLQLDDMAGTGVRARMMFPAGGMMI